MITVQHGVPMTRLLLIIFTMFNWRCSPPPPVELPEKKLDQHIASMAVKEAKALWILTTDFSFGQLGRLDLTTGEFNPSVLPTVSDAVVLPDQDNGLFLLNRGGNDSLQILRNSTGDDVAVRPLTEKINPQYAIRDNLDRVWVTSLNSNSVQIFSSDLSQLVAEISLEGLKDSFDPYAELSSIIPLSQGEMGVVALRTKREFIDGNWVADETSGLAIIDIQSLTVKSLNFLPVANALGVYLLPNHFLHVVGSGDLSPLNKSDSKELLISLQEPSGYEIIQSKNNHFRILDSSLSSSGVTASILWKADKKKSCIMYGNVTVLCESDEKQGHVFQKILVIGKVIFAFYHKDKNNELWSIPLDGSPVQRMNMGQWILGLSPGP